MYLPPAPITPVPTQSALSTSKQDSTELWHRRLAHINSRALPTLHEHVEDVPKLSEMEDVCRACRLGKARKLPFVEEWSFTPETLMLSWRVLKCITV